jgi:hypothetical protein
VWKGRRGQATKHRSVLTQETTARGVCGGGCGAVLQWDEDAAMKIASEVGRAGPPGRLAGACGGVGVAGLRQIFQR